MKYAILGDIHANFEALNTVVEDALTRGVTCFISVGDIVGYGPEPSACIALLKKIDAQAVAGNHDWAVLDKLDLDYFNPYAQSSILWTQKNISPADKLFLSSLPLTLCVNDMTVVHGTLHNPDAFFYMQSTIEAQRSFDLLKNTLCVCGHSHLPIFFIKENNFVTNRKENEIYISENAQVIANVGSVGQPRDKDPRTLYALYDDQEKSIKLYRLSYDILSTTTKITCSGLPKYNADRLLKGV